MNPLTGSAAKSTKDRSDHNEGEGVGGTSLYTVVCKHAKYSRLAVLELSTRSGALNRLDQSQQ